MTLNEGKTRATHNVGEDAAVGSGVVPAQDGVEDHPSSVVGDLRVSVVDVLRESVS